MQQSVTLSVCEAELHAATDCAQDMMYMCRSLLSIGLKVKLPMKLGIDNQGTIALINNWSSGGRTRHVDTKLYFLRELKEEEPPIIATEYVPTKEMDADIFTKNTDTTTFNEHVPKFCGEDEYIELEEGNNKKDSNEK